MGTPHRHTSAPSSAHSLAPSSAPSNAPSNAPAKSVWHTSSLSGLAKTMNESKAASSNSSSEEPLSRAEFAEFKAMILSVLQNKDQGIPALPQPSQALSIGVGRTNQTKPGILSQLSASIGSDGSVPRTKTSPSTPHPVRPIMEDQEDDLLNDVNVDGKVDEPSAKTIEDAKNVFIGPSQFKNVEINHLGKYMIWFRHITWKDGRNRREANTICRALDAFISESVDPIYTSIGFEILSRRLSSGWIDCDE